MVEEAKALYLAVQDKCLSVMGRIGVALSGGDRERNQTATSLHAKAGRLPNQVARHERV
jgi:hypothetical protein